MNKYIYAISVFSNLEILQKNEYLTRNKQITNFIFFAELNFI